jgi:hypothetical protein
LAVVVIGIILGMLGIGFIEFLAEIGDFLLAQLLILF